MKKYLLLTGLLAVLTLNSAHADSYYYENDGYYIERVPHERKTYYLQPRYTNTEYISTEAPRYRRMTNAEAKHYRERQVYKDSELTINRIRPYIGIDVGTQKIKFSDSEDEDYFKDSTKSISGIIGAKINKHFGIEAYYQQSSEEEKNKEKVIMVSMMMPSTNTASVTNLMVQI